MPAVMHLVSAACRRLSSFHRRKPLCFTGTIDNRDGRARSDAFRVRQFAAAGDPPIADNGASKVEVLKEHHVAQPGAIATDQYVVHGDRSVGQIVELGPVGYPVADVRICFDGTISESALLIVLNRVARADERAAPSYAAWRL
jgi:hypothetical protein